VLAGALLPASCQTHRVASTSALLLKPDAPEMNRRAPDQFRVRLDTNRGAIEIEVHRDWAPHGADRFYNLVRGGYYDDARFFRVMAGRWAQFGINGDPKISAAWRERTIPDDPRRESNVRGTIAFAFAVPNGRTTEVFINLRDNSGTHDAEPFVPFGKVIEGMEVADSLNAEYGESAGGGIRGGKQGPLFEQGNAWLEKNYPRLDFIRRATIEKASQRSHVRSSSSSFSSPSSIPTPFEGRGRERGRGRENAMAGQLSGELVRDSVPAMDLFSLATSGDLAPTFRQVLESQITAFTLRST
jgi:cyclophilin family peptidyl-prolyl cis-trans isomerase